MKMKTQSDLGLCFFMFLKGDKKMKKGIIWIIIAIIVVVAGYFITGCETVEVAPSVENEFRLEHVHADVYVLTDVYTGVEYIIVETSGGIAITPRFDGTETMSSYLKLR